MFSVGSNSWSGVWKYESTAETNIVDVYIRYLRGKIDLPGQKSYIKTVRGIGYANARINRILFDHLDRGFENLDDSRKVCDRIQGYSQGISKSFAVPTKRRN